MKNVLYLIIIGVVFSACGGSEKGKVTDYVDTFIGTDGHGHTYPGATLPFGMVQLSPDTRKDSWDGCSGYHYSDSTIMGFSHTHLSGTGVGDYGDIRIMPMTGNLLWNPGDESNPRTGYRSRFSHDDESSQPGYYSVMLKDYGIHASFTVTERVGLHKYNFPEGRKKHILIDLVESITSDRIIELEVEILNDREISGMRRTDGWSDDQYVFFHAIFSEPFDETGVIVNDSVIPDLMQASGNSVKSWVSYDEDSDDEVMVKVGISAVSKEGAARNLDEEMPGWNFDKIKRNALKVWEDELSAIEIEDDREDLKTVFYTALYHSFLAPNLYADVDGSYRGHDLEVHEDPGHEVYTVFSLWDTYRAAHPLYTILQPERDLEFIKTMLDIYEKGGILPVWELAANETNCMIGYHSIPVITDAYIKGIDDFDVDKAYEAMKKSAAQDHFGLDAYREYGYIPADVEGESVSKTLEYAYDDWCIAVMAKALGDEDGYREYIQRAQYYKNLFDPDTRFIRGKKNGIFTTPFDPTEVNFMLTEANTWQYTFYVPQDISGLIDLMGGDEGFERKLDEMFSSSPDLAGRQQADITGLIGQYAHGNEPSHHMAYLYSYIGEPYKTQKIVRQIMDELYHEGPAGLCGNEDCGQMSAWYVFSSMGFYPVTPGMDYYVLGSPLFKKVTIHLPNGEDFVLEAEGTSSQNKYITATELNGEEHTKSHILHEDILKGGKLTFKMGTRPNRNWGFSPEDRPVSVIDDHPITPVPFIRADNRIFRERMTLALDHINDSAVIRYSTGNTIPGRYSPLYTDSITINRDVKINTYANLPGKTPSKVISAEFFRLPHDYTIQIKNPYSSQYTGGGDLALVDMIRGTDNFRTGAWQGYYGIDMEVIIDLGERKRVNSIKASFLEDQNSWIFKPEEVIFEVSQKPYDFKTVAIIRNRSPERMDEPVIHEYLKTRLRLTSRYIKVIAKNIGVCPEWHKGAGNKAWIFADEITVN